MGLEDTLYNHRKNIIIGGLLLGVLISINILPETTTMFGLDENVRYVYAAVVGIAGYTFYKFYYSLSPARYRSTVPSRSLSSSKFAEDLAQKYQRTMQPQRRPPTPPDQSSDKIPVSNQTFDVFNKE